MNQSEMDTEIRGEMQKMQKATDGVASFIRVFCGLCKPKGEKTYEESHHDND